MTEGLGAGTERRTRRLKQWWRAGLLAALAEGHRLAAACTIADVSAATVARHRAVDPSLDGAIKEALGALHGRRGSVRDISWHGAFLQALERCGSLAKAAEQVGVATFNVYEHRIADAAFGEQVQQTLDRHATHANEGDAARWWDIGQKISNLVSAGMPLKTAAVECGTNVTALNSRRKTDPALDEQINAARQAGAQKLHQQYVESWEGPFLAAIADGQGFKDACRIAGVHLVSMYRERWQNPAFEAKVRQALIDSGRGFDSDARRMLLLRLLNGAALEEALASAGVTREQFDEACATDPRLAEKLRPYISGGGHGKAHRAQRLKCHCRRCRNYRNAAEQKRRARRRLDRFPQQARDAFLDLVQSGARVVDAARQVGVSWQTIYVVAGDDEAFSARLDEATRANCTCDGSGRTGQGRQRCECPESRQRHAEETKQLRAARRG